MKAEVKLINKEVASKMLQTNIANRKINEAVVNNYAKMMIEGEWKENGESIIIDCNGVFKDGQHRLAAIIKSNVSLNFVVVTDVDADVMDSIDVGKKRSLKDVLEIEGFKQTTLLASIITAIHTYKLNYYSNRTGIPITKSTFLSNAKALEYAYNHSEELRNIVLQSEKIYRLSRKFMPKSFIGKMLYIISEYRIRHEHIEFLEYLTGIKYMRGTAASYIFDLYVKSKDAKTPLKNEWLTNASIKAWNMYVQGNMPVKYVRVGDKNEKPVIL